MTVGSGLTLRPHAAPDFRDYYTTPTQNGVDTLWASIFQAIALLPKIFPGLGVLSFVARYNSAVGLWV